MESSKRKVHFAYFLCFYIYIYYALFLRHLSQFLRILPRGRKRKREDIHACLYMALYVFVVNVYIYFFYFYTLILVILFAHIISICLSKRERSVNFVLLFVIINLQFFFHSTTDSDGRCGNLLQDVNCAPGRFKIEFRVNDYFKRITIASIYPMIDVMFDVQHPGEHYHIPLLLSPFGFTIYRGSWLRLRQFRHIYAAADVIKRSERFRKIDLICGLSRRMSTCQSNCVRQSVE